jgi:fermentation-respiration switch protein FrsA (DUF1100 family)
MKTFNSLKDLSEDEAKQITIIGASGYYYKDLDAYPYNEKLMQSTKPILIMQGGKDFQVSAVKDYLKYKTLLQANRNVSFKLYRQLNHFFITSTTGKIDEYNISDNVHEQVLNDIIDWINK